jgi:two-component system, NtrC family, sensor histidine kinase HydH
MVEGDPEQLHQVFVNLLINGIDVAGDGGELHVSVEVGPPSPQTCRVIVRDSGSGIPSAVLERIFEPFVTTKERGTGLGLAISRRIVQEHGGTLTAANPSRGGAVFTVELPLGTINDGSAAAVAPPPPKDCR